MTFTSYIDQVRAERPLVHHITNYVTVNDCANACLAIGASPVMADAVDEAESMVSIAQSLVLNIGTLNVTKVEAMMVAGRKANALGIPVVFDPVGVGATPFRNRMAAELMRQIRIAVVRGNISEICSLGGEAVRTKGVDAGHADAKVAEEVASMLAKKWHATVVISGKTDIITDGKGSCISATAARRCRISRVPAACVLHSSVRLSVRIRRILSAPLPRRCSRWGSRAKEPGDHMGIRGLAISTWAFWMSLAA